MQLKAKGVQTEATDARLVERVLEGDIQAYELLVRRYEDALYNFCYRLSRRREAAEELAQDAFVKAYKSLHRFDSSRKFSTWLFAIANNAAIDRWRAAGAEPVPFDELSPAAEPAGSIGEPEREVLGRELGESLEAALVRLPYNYRAALVLRHIEGLSYAELAEALYVPEGTVKTWLHRGRELLKKDLMVVIADEV